MESLEKNNGKKSLPVGELRTHRIYLLLNDRELAQLDAARGRHQRAEAARMLLDRLPAPVPEINADLRADLGRALGNLATIGTSMRGGEYIPLDDIKQAIFDLRDKLAGARL
jgi:hypothetical protein